MLTVVKEIAAVIGVEHTLRIDQNRVVITRGLACRCLEIARHAHRHSVEIARAGEVVLDRRTGGGEQLGVAMCFGKQRLVFDQGAYASRLIRVLTSSARSVKSSLNRWRSRVTPSGSGTSGWAGKSTSFRPAR
jgi:hypothetical protein